MTEPFVSIIIPAYNSEKTIVRAIKASLAQDYPRTSYEVIVVDDGSTDKTRLAIEGYPVKYLYQKNQGPAAARNMGMKNARGTIVAFLDSDCVPRKQWLSKMIAQYTSPEIVCVGSRYGIVNRQSLLACLIYFEFLIRYKRMPRHPKFLGSHGYSFRKDVLLALGGYCEEYTMASHEDNELAYRIYARGYYAVFDKTNIVEHHFPTNIIKYLRIQFWHGYWRMKAYRDHPKMVTGDDYSDVWDYMQPPLALLILVLFPFIWMSGAMVFFVCAISVLLSLQIPIALSIYSLSHKKRYYIYIPFGLVRALARGFGMLKGIYCFWLGPFLKKQHMYEAR